MPIRNIEKRRAYHQAYQLKNRQKIAAKQVQIYLEKRDHRISYQLNWAAENPEKKRASNRRWEKENPESGRVRCRNRCARKKAATGSHSVEDIDSLFKLQKGKCAYCRDSLREGFHVDHIKPLVKKGSNDRRNLQLLCQDCNRRKSVKDPLVFARQRGFLL